MTTRVSFTRTQWAVGQGFFHSGEVASEGASVLYVYDCGSLYPDALQRELDEFFRRHGDQTVDLLFISHYHYDHVSGLDRLLRDGTVDTVVIPVLEPAERLVALALTAPAERIGGWETRFAADPVDALQEIAPGIEILQVAPSPDVDADGEDDVDLAPVDVEMGTTGTEGVAPPSDVALRIGRTTSTLEGKDANDDPVALWEWRAYTTSFAQRKRDALLRHLASALNRDPSALRQDLNDAAFFRQLLEDHHDTIADAFRQAFNDVNLSSLLVYSGPAAERKRWGRVYRTRHGFVDGREIGAWDVLPGWFGTGDQSMGIRRCNEVAKKFGDTLWRVGVLALPHHGSHDSYHRRLVEMFPDAKPTCVASAGLHSKYKHPSMQVIADVADQGGTPVIVTESETSRTSESGGIDL